MKTYILGRGYVDIAKNIFEKLFNSSPIQTLTRTALTKAAEVAGDKIGSFTANKIADRLIPQKPSDISMKAIEELERKIRGDIESHSGKGFKLIR